MATADLWTRLLTDDEIVERACFPVLDRKCAPREDYRMACVIHAMGKKGASPLAMVIWPTGVKIVATISPGDRSKAANALLIKSYRQAEAGQLGTVPMEGAP